MGTEYDNPSSSAGDESVGKRPQGSEWFADQSCEKDLFGPGGGPPSSMVMNKNLKATLQPG